MPVNNNAPAALIDIVFLSFASRREEIFRSSSDLCCRAFFCVSNSLTIISDFCLSSVVCSSFFSSLSIFSESSFFSFSSLFCAEVLNRSVSISLSWIIFSTVRKSVVPNSVGVENAISATFSANGVSALCPMAHNTGIGHSKNAFAILCESNICVCQSKRDPPW